jgi:hypothetical protein
VTTLPAAFWVGVRIRDGTTGGKLTIDRRELSLRLWGRPGGQSDPPIVHTNPDVRVLRARLVPPWVNTHVLVECDRGMASVALPAWKRKEVTAALTAAGLAVREEKRWVAVGAGADWR